MDSAIVIVVFGSVRAKRLAHSAAAARVGVRGTPASRDNTSAEKPSWRLMEVLPVGDRAFRRDPLAVAHCGENAADRVVRMARARDRLSRLTSPLGVPRVGSGEIPERPLYAMVHGRRYTFV